jgi:hypothetical protein
MSRAERRAYKRMTKNQDPYAPPGGAAARGRAPRQRARRARPAGPFTFVTGRFMAWALGGALAIGLIGFSIAWPNGMPTALYAGLAAALAWGLLAVAVRLMQRRMATPQR